MFLKGSSMVEEYNFNHYILYMRFTENKKIWKTYLDSDKQEFVLILLLNQHLVLYQNLTLHHEIKHKRIS